MIVRLHSEKEYKNIPFMERFSADFDYDRIPHFAEVEIDDDIDLMQQPIEYEGKFYVVGRMTTTGNIRHAVLDDYTAFNPDVELDEETNESELTCPVCGHVTTDSWELSDSSDEHHCENCRSVLSYERNVSVSYTATIVEVAKPIKL